MAINGNIVHIFPDAAGFYFWRQKTAESLGHETGFDLTHTTNQYRTRELSYII